MNFIKILYWFPTFLFVVKQACRLKWIRGRLDEHLRKLLLDDSLKEKYKHRRSKYMLCIGRKGMPWEYVIKKRAGKFKKVGNYKTEDLLKTDGFLVQRLIAE